MLGMDAETGRQLSGRAHLEQSIRTVVLTRLRTRTMLRDFGCGGLDAVDRGESPSAVAASVAAGLARWEPRAAVTRVTARDGALDIEAVDLEGPDAERPLKVRISDFNADYNADFGA